MAEIDLSALEPSDDFLFDLGRNVWLMDDHRWALLVWERERRSSKYSLVHADHHWDAVYDFYGDKDEEKKLLDADVDRIKEYLVEGLRIRYDSFIAPAVFRGMFDVCHFFCKQSDHTDVALHKELLEASQTTQEIHTTVDTLVRAQFKHPIVFDLCLDLFNRSDQWQTGDLWANQEIQSFLQSVRHIISAAEIVTVSLSFGYSGTHQDTRALAQLVLPIILASRSDA